MQDDITGLEVDLMELEGDVNFLFDETVIQDDRIYNLEQTTIGILGDVDSEYYFIKVLNCQIWTVGISSQQLLS